jgi:uncharacterized alpha-E superfamily protein
MSRYLERVENSARLVAVYGELLLDLPEEARLDWPVALEILGMEAAFKSHTGGTSELSFLLTSKDNVASVLSSLGFARENARTTRDIVPTEAWRAINEMYLYARQNLPDMVQRPGSKVPAELVGRCHEITGILEGTMSHGPAYQFVRLGRSLERVDMTSRIIDVAAAILLTGQDDLPFHAGTIWRAVLRAQSAYQMYRQYVRRRILGNDVVVFLLKDENFPRSVVHCIGVLDSALAQLPRAARAQGQTNALRARLEAIKVTDLDHAHLHQFVDDLQLELAALNDVIFDTWLNPLIAA